MSHRPTILVIDDEPGMQHLLTRLLQPKYTVAVASSGAEGLAQVDAMAPDLVLLDLRLPQMSGMSVLRKLRDTRKDVPVIILTGHVSVDTAVQALKLGAVDYLAKPFTAQQFEHTLQAFFAGRKTIQELPSCQGIIGESAQIRRVWQLLERYGPTDLPILLQGETGTGKELFARALHEFSKRSQGPFAPVDCAALPEALVESEIFGYHKGAFTGADGDKPGLLAWANGGTLFLDEIGNLPLSYQAKLLRVIQEQRYIPLGGREMKTLDTRFVSAYNLDLQEATERGTFRKDLYYRIAGVTIVLPPLREREGDIALLARHFVQVYSRKYQKPPVDIADETMELLRAYHWPGNVRELEHVIAGAVILADQCLSPEHLAPYLRGLSPLVGDGADIVVTLRYRCNSAASIDLKKIKHQAAAEAERQLLTAVQQQLSLTQTELARFLHIDPKTLRSKKYLT